MAGVVAIMCSVWRPGPVVHAAVTAALSEPLIDQVVVFGYEPTGLAVSRPMPRTLYHAALRKHAANATRDVLGGGGNKFSTRDDGDRVRWRARLALDAWACFVDARRMFPSSTLLWLENDAILIPGAVGAALAAARKTGAAACYGSGGWYRGSGTLCFVFTPEIDPAPHMLSYHLVQPLDWILSDFSRGGWPIRRAVRHGVGTPHKSTRTL